MMKSEPSHFTAAIVGCGRIAHTLDAECADGVVLTHARAYEACAATELLAVCDVDREVAECCAAAHGVRAFTDVREMLDTCGPDMVSICTPDATHLDQLALCAEIPGKAIWCEKPVGVRGQSPVSVVERLEREGRLVAVNYMRRWEPEHVKLGEKLRAGAYGRIDKAVACYSKGLLHNGSHFLDLFMSWFGQPESWQVLGAAAGPQREDPALDVRLCFPGEVTAYLLAGNVEHYSQDEIDLWTEKGRVQITEYSRKIRFQSTEFSKAAGKYKLTGPVERSDTSYDRLMLTILEDIVSALSRGTALPSTGRTALETLRLGDAILDEWERAEAEKEQ